MSQYDASSSAVGYLFQCRHALHSGLKRVRENRTFSLTLELLDDVAFEAAGAPAELLQLKHHQKESANLTDASPDLWKTLRVWIDQSPADALLFLVTTSTAGDGSTASYLRDDQARDPQKALQSLQSTARTSKSQVNEKAYKAFLELDDKPRQELVSRIYVVDRATDIGDLDEQVRAQIRFAVERKYETSFVQRLEGWWFRRCVDQLSDSSDAILSEELESRIDELREQFKRDSLPIDDDILEKPISQEGYEDSIFVKQLALAEIGAARVLAAVRDYYRAFEQRSRWVREDLLLVGELDRYERTLREEWELVFERIKDELGPAPAELAKRDAAREICRWVETNVIPIRHGVTEAFVTRGSLHLLADKLQVGWHPEFMERLQHLLEERTA